MRRNHKRGDVGCKNKGPVHRVKGTDSEPCAQGDGSSWCERRRCDEGKREDGARTTDGGLRVLDGGGTTGAACGGGIQGRDDRDGGRTSEGRQGREEVRTVGIGWSATTEDGRDVPRCSVRETLSAMVITGNEGVGTCAAV